MQTSPKNAVAQYARFVAEGKGQPSPWEHLKHQVFLGSDSFVDAMQRMVPKNRDVDRLPLTAASRTRQERFGQRPGLGGVPPVEITELTGLEFGGDATKRDLLAAASGLMRTLQGGGGIRNSDTGWQLTANKSSRKKIGGNTEQSLDELRIVAGIEALAKRAVLVEMHPDDAHRNPDVVAIGRLYAPVALAGDLLRVKLTVKVYKAEAGAKKALHALSAVEIENAPLGTFPAYSDAEALQQGQPTTGRRISIAHLLRGATLTDGSDVRLRGEG